MKCYICGQRGSEPENWRDRRSRLSPDPNTFSFHSSIFLVFHARLQFLFFFCCFCCFCRCCCCCIRKYNSAIVQRKPAVTGYLSSQQIPPFGFASQDSRSTTMPPAAATAAVQSQKTVTAYLKSKQLLPFGFARQQRKLCNPLQSKKKPCRGARSVWLAVYVWMPMNIFWYLGDGQGTDGGDGTLTLHIPAFFMTVRLWICYTFIEICEFYALSCHWIWKYSC